MRTYTLVLSIIVHASVACGVLLSTVLATDELPEPRRSSVFVEVFAPQPDALPPPPRIRADQPAAPSSVPVAAPAGIHPEPERLPQSEVIDAVPDGAVVGAGIDAGLLIMDAPPPPVAEPPGPVRVGGTVRPPEKVHHVSPVYPAIARSANVEGVVILETTIDESGLVRNVRVLRSEPLLDHAAVDAVRQWRFTPTLLNGQPVSVLMTVTVAFSLD